MIRGRKGANAKDTATLVWSALSLVSNWCRCTLIRVAVDRPRAVFVVVSLCFDEAAMVVGQTVRGRRPIREGERY